jgi:hypothetical protein
MLRTRILPTSNAVVFGNDAPNQREGLAMAFFGRLFVCSPSNGWRWELLDGSEVVGSGRADTRDEAEVDATAYERHLLDQKAAQPANAK